MDDYKNTVHPQEEEKVAAEEAEEALSLSNLPVNTNEPENGDFLNSQNHPPSPEPSELFEFFSDLSSEMSHAEDIFFCGKLVPLQEKALSDGHIHKLPCKDDKLKGFHRRRCESLSESKIIDRSNSSTKTRLMRNSRSSRSLDYRKMYRNSSLRCETPNIVRALSDKSSEKSDASWMKISKPRWYILMFGLVKFPQEMDLQDIKTRQIRRKPGTIFPVNQSDRKSSWGLLRMLSCKNHASVAVTASIGYVPQV